MAPQTVKLLFTALSLCFWAIHGLENIHINPATRSFVDDFQRTRVFHGMNAVYKIAPWHPTLTGYDGESTLSDVDSENLGKWGFNVVRLGVMWPGVEPTSRGVYNQTYLDNIEYIVSSLAKNNIYVILDFHQDLWHRKFCGEGVPDYVYETCVKAEPSDTKAFPLPAVNVTYPNDEDGNPDLDSCLSVMFATYYMSSEVGAGFQCLYDNVDNLWDAFAGYWKTVASRFSTFDNVLGIICNRFDVMFIGYELINEPWLGDVYANPKNLLPQYTEKQYLQPLYEFLHKEIRTIDDKKIIFFEGVTLDYWPNGFTAGPGGAAYNDRQALAYHIYCPIQDPTVVLEKACDVINAEFMGMRRHDTEKIGVAMIMTEFGAAEDTSADMYALEQTAALADKYQQSWMYWQFKYYQDLTTCTPQGESMYNADGTICMDKLKVLSRTYPMATAGTLVSYEFNYHTLDFNMEYTPLAVLNNGTPGTANGDDDKAHTTEIFYNKDTFYTNGINVEVTGALATSMKVICPKIIGGSHSIVSIVQTAAITEADTGNTKVKISACRNPIAALCTCH